MFTSASNSVTPGEPSAETNAKKSSEYTGNAIDNFCYNTIDI